MTLKEPQPAHTFSKDAANPSLCPLDFASDTGAGREALTWFIPCFGPHLGVDPSVCISACQRAMCSCPFLAFVLCLDVRCAPTERPLSCCAQPECTAWSCQLRCTGAAACAPRRRRCVMPWAACGPLASSMASLLHVHLLRALRAYLLRYALQV